LFSWPVRRNWRAGARTRRSVTELPAADALVDAFLARFLLCDRSRSQRRVEARPLTGRRQAAGGRRSVTDALSTQSIARKPELIPLSLARFHRRFKDLHAIALNFSSRLALKYAFPFRILASA